jgi:hypothetical protein
MKHNHLFFFCSAALSLGLAVSCSVPGSQTPSSSVASPPTVLISNYNGTFSYTVDAGTTAKDVYFVFSNTSLDTSAGAATVANSVGTIKVDGTEIAASSAQPAGGPSVGGGLLSAIAASNRDIMHTPGHRDNAASVSRNVSAPSFNGVAGIPGASDSFLDFQNSDQYYPTESVPAHCQYHGPVIQTAQGPRTIDIWVADDCYTGSSSGKRHLVDSTMVQELAKRFLLDGVTDPAIKQPTNDWFMI